MRRGSTEYQDWCDAVTLAGNADLASFTAKELCIDVRSGKDAGKAKKIADRANANLSKIEAYLSRVNAEDVNQRAVSKVVSQQERVVIMMKSKISLYVRYKEEVQ